MSASRPVPHSDRGAAAPVQNAPREDGLESRLDALCRSVAEVFAVPMAAIALIDADRIRFRARYGLAEAVIDRDDALCHHTIHQPRGHALVVPDLIRDEHFVHSPLVVGAPHARFYAGLAIRSGAGRVVGTLCLMDRVPRDDVSFDRVRVLQELALVAEAHLELDEARRASEAAERRRAEAHLLEWEARQRALEAAHAMAEQIAAFGHWRIDAATRTIAWSDGIARIFGRNAERATLPLETHIGFYHPEDCERVWAAMDEALAGRSRTLGGATSNALASFVPTARSGWWPFTGSANTMMRAGSSRSSASASMSPAWPAPSSACARPARQCGPLSRRWIRASS